jgi:hypothetical protein
MASPRVVDRMIIRAAEARLSTQTSGSSLQSLNGRHAFGAAEYAGRSQLTSPPTRITAGGSFDFAFCRVKLVVVPLTAGTQTMAYSRAASSLARVPAIEHNNRSILWDTISQS